MRLDNHPFRLLGDRGFLFDGRRGQASEINAPTPINAINAMNQILVRADSHAPEIDECLSWKMAVITATTILSFSYEEGRCTRT